MYWYCNDDVNLQNNGKQTTILNYNLLKNKIKNINLNYELKLENKVKQMNYTKFEINY